MEQDGPNSRRVRVWEQNLVLSPTGQGVKTLYPHRDSAAPSPGPAGCKMHRGKPDCLLWYVSFGVQ